jgi:hypothetical protein
VVAPSELELDKRRFPRHPRRIPCELWIEGIQYTGIVKDVSSGGLLVRTHAEAAPGTAIIVIIAPANGQPDIRVSGRVLRLNREQTLGTEAVSAMAIELAQVGALSRLLLG